MQPFEKYPGGGRSLLGPVKGANTRREDGPPFMRLTGQRTCAYCGIDFNANYETWLTMVLDHVIPAKFGKEMDIPQEWCEDQSNRVLSCAACNGFCNRYKCVDTDPPKTLEAFYDLRDRIFAERRRLILEAHESERKFYETRPWESPQL